MGRRILGVGVLENPNATPIATAVSYVGAQTLTASITSGSTTITLAAAATGFSVGQSISGTGIAPGSVIASITSTTVIVSSLAATATNGSASLTFAAYNPLQSQWAGNSSFYPQPPAGTVPVPDSYMDIPNTQTVATVGSYVLPPGDGVVVVTTLGTSAVVTVQYQIGAAGTWVTFNTVTATNGANYKSDGTNCRVNVASGSTATTFLALQFA